MMKSSVLKIVFFLIPLLLFVSCANPQKVDIKLPKEKVVKKISNYTTALDKLGQMTDIYDSKSLKIQSKGVTDDTGTAQATGGEIPVDITEMIKSSLNKVGGRLQYIDYDPSHQSNMMALGYTKFQNKIIPNLVISGGITEFDRSLEVRGTGSDLGADGTINGKKLGLEFGDSSKTASASITLDISLIDFETWAMIPKMTASNRVVVNSGTSSSELGFSILAFSFGLNGNIKKVQGRHAATRLLVELSLIEVIGRYLDLPYWKILPNGKVDKVVVRSISNKYLNSSKKSKIIMIQKTLYLHGYDVPINGSIDDETKVVIDKYKNSSEYVGDSYDSLELFKELYLNIPIENNFRSATIFSGYLKSTKPKKQQQKVITTSQPLVQEEQKQQQQPSQSIPKAKNLTAKGVFKNKNESLATNMATNMALNSLSKKLGKVIQSEYSNVMNENIMMKITTNAKNIVSGYEILSSKYNEKTFKAEVIIQLDGEIIDDQIEENRRAD